MKDSEIIDAGFRSLNKQHFITVLPPDEGGTVYNGVTLIATDLDGTIISMPRVITETDWTCEKWIDIATNQEITMGMVLTKDITIKPVMKHNVQMVTVTFKEDFYGKIVSGDKSVQVPKGTAWSQVPKPVASALSGYLFAGWYNGSTKLDNDYVVNGNLTATTKSVEDATQWFRFTEKEDGTMELWGWDNTKMSKLQALTKKPDPFYVASEIDGKPVTSVRAGAFSNQTPTNLGFSAKLVLPGSIQTIGEKAFYQNTAFTEITLNEGLLYIGDSAFEGSAITYIEVPTTVTGMGDSVFRFSQLKDIKICGQAINGAGNYMCANTQISLFVYPEDTVYVPDNMFSGCQKLYYLVLNEGIEEIGWHIISDTPKLTSVNIPKTTRIMEAAFGYSSITSAVVPGTVTSWAQAFNNSTALRTVTIEDGVTNIDHNVFAGCTKLQSANIPASVTNIDAFAFGNCSNIFLEVPDTVLTIDTAAFTGAYKIYYNGPAVDPLGANWGAQHRG